MPFDFFEVHDISVLVVHIKKVDLMGKGTTIKATLLYNHGVKPVRVCINNTGSNAAAGTFSANNQAVGAIPHQVSYKWRSEKHAGPFFIDYQISGLRPKFFPDLIGAFIDTPHLTFGRFYPFWVNLLSYLNGRIDDGYPIGPRH